MAGTDADPATAYRQDLIRRAGTAGEEFALDDFDRTGVPVQAVVWDLPGDVDAFGVGYGATRHAAEVGALGEVAERVIMSDALRALPVTTASYTELRAAVGADGVVDPVALILDAGSAYCADEPLQWVPSTRWRTGETVLVPAEYAAFDRGSLPPQCERPLITPITNGLGAGDTLERAVGHALLELVQRDGDNLAFRALDQGVVVDLADAPAGVRAIRDRFRAAGIEPVVKLAGTEFACVVYCVGHDDSPDAPPMALGAIGEAAHPDRSVAIVKAMLEYASSRARRVFSFGPLDAVRRHAGAYLDGDLRRPVGAQEPRALDAMRAWTDLTAGGMRELLEPLFRRRRTIAFADLPSAPDEPPAQLLTTMLDRLADFDVLVVAGGEPGSVRAAKVLAPGLEVETMSYLRVGERAARQLLERGSDLVGLGAASAPDRLPVPLTAASQDRLGGPVWVDPGAVERAMGELYPLYREPRRHAVQRAAEQG